MTRRELVAGVLGAGAASGMQAGRGVVIDAHNHLNFRSRPSWAEDDRELIEAADKLGIDQLCCSILPPERQTSG